MPEPVQPGPSEWRDTDIGSLTDALRAAGNPDAIIEGWAAQCRTFTLEDPERGVAAAAMLVEIARTLASPRVLARSLSAQGHALSYAGRMKQALAITEQAIEQAERSADPLAIAEACMTAVQSHNVLGLREEALRLASRAGDIFRDLGDRDRSATAIMLAGVVLRMLDRPEEALARYDAALGVIGTQPSLRAQLSSNRAEALLDIGRFAEAQRSFESAAEGFRDCGQDFGVAIVEGNLADLASRRGEIHDALRLFLDASAKFRAARDEAEAARLEAEAAELFLSIGDHREPLACLPGAIESLNAAGMQTELARATAALGVALARAGDTDAALDAFAESERQSRMHNQPHAAARALALRGSALLHAGKAEEAAAALTKALVETPLQPTRARTLTDLAFALADAGQLQAAQAALDEAADIAQRFALADIETAILTAHARLARLAGDTRGARTHALRALDLAAQRRNLFSSDRLRATAQHNTRLASEEGTLIALAESDPSLAFDVAERSVARSSIDSLAARSPRNGSHETRRLEGDIAATLAQIEDARAVGRDPSAILRLRERLRTLELSLASHTVAEESRAPTSAVADSTLTLEEFQAAVPEGVLTLSVARAGNHFARLAITRTSARLDRLRLGPAEAAATCARLLAAIDRALVRLTTGRSISSDLNQQIHESLASLGSALFTGLEHELTHAQRLVAVLPPELARLPLPALTLGGTPLAAHTTPTLAPSLGWAYHRAQRPTPLRNGLLVVGVADQLAPAIEAEALAVASTAPNAKLLLSHQATLDQLRRECPSRATIHLACHGEYSPIDPMGSRIRLADGWHSGRALAELDLTGAQIVLSGCETGTSESISGEWFGLVRACIQAGAQSIAACHWRLADEAASAVFSELYRSPNGQTIPLPAALSRTQAEYSSRGMHPALWGGLFAIGSWT